MAEKLGAKLEVVGSNSCEHAYLSGVLFFLDDVFIFFGWCIYYRSLRSVLNGGSLSTGYPAFFSGSGC